MALLDITDLHVSFNTSDGIVQAVRGLSFSVDAGQTLGIVGESGSGKSVSMQTVIGLTSGARISGQALFEGTDLLTMGRKDLQAIRGAQIGMIFQDPLSSLHPYYRVGWQISEMILAHERGVSKRQARGRAIELLRLVGIARPEERVDDYPHQFSGGMRQRAMIAMALLFSPELILMDEPTSALDVVAQRSLMVQVKQLQKELGFAIIFVTHDMSLVAHFSDRVAVMYAGQVVEARPTRALFNDPLHPYTQGLLEAFPSVYGPRVPLEGIPGSPPDLAKLPAGCNFNPRCPKAFSLCTTTDPALYEVDGALVRCLLYSGETSQLEEKTPTHAND
jgi:peptide/nickel transport system ATP-binding protein